MNNKAFSLIELIVVIAILSVLAGVSAIGIGLVSGKPAESCANKLVSAIQSNRITAMGKMDARLEIYEDGNGIWIREVITEVGEPDKVTTVRIGDKGVRLEFQITGDAADFWRPIGDAGHPLILHFNRSSGAFQDLSLMGASYEGKYCVAIRSSKARTVKRISLTYLTGKIALE